MPNESSLDRLIQNLLGGDVSTDTLEGMGLVLAARVELAQLRERLGWLRAALKPFADYAAARPAGWPQGYQLVIEPRASLEGGELTLGDCRRAREALNQ